LYAQMNNKTIKIKKKKERSEPSWNGVSHCDEQGGDSVYHGEGRARETSFQPSDGSVSPTVETEHQGRARNGKSKD
jgi:hypothetical protein